MLASVVELAVPLGAICAVALSKGEQEAVKLPIVVMAGGGVIIPAKDIDRSIVLATANVAQFETSWA